MIKLEPYKARHFPQLSYDLNETQLQFVATPERSLDKIAQTQDRQKHPVCIFSDEEICGFLILDFSKDKLEYTVNSQAVLLRSFSINPRFQGKGIGKKAMLLVADFVKDKFPGTSEIVLSVNFRNTIAYELYLSCGFIKEDKTITGRSGPQYVLSHKLPE